MEDGPEHDALAGSVAKGDAIKRIRRPETDLQRQTRLKENTQKQDDAQKAADNALDAMVKRSIDRHGV